MRMTTTDVEREIENLGITGMTARILRKWAGEGRFDLVERGAMNCYGLAYLRIGPRTSGW